MAGTRRVALISGGARGIGFGVALALAREGLDLALFGRSELPEEDERLEMLRSHGVAVLYVAADVSDADDRRRLMDEVRRRYGRLDVLVSNAGVAPLERRHILEATEESFERIIRINLQGPYFLTQLAARWMIEQGSPEEDAFRRCIVNITSISSTVASPSRGDYCISKAGLSMMTKLWAAGLAEHGIPVFEVRPGIIRTDMTSAVEEKYDRMIEEGLLLQPRWGTPDDVGLAVAALVRGDFAYSTGTVVMVDGGLTVSRL